ncbi:MAG: DUF3224 domain-containing protein [Nitrolancea sp.]
MSTQANGGIETQSWDEQTIEELGDGRKTTRVSATSKLSGDIEGESRVEFLLAYTGDDYCSFVGIERVSGNIGGRQGSFVLQQQGTFENGGIRLTWFVVPGSGSDGLSGLHGEGGYVWNGEHGVPTPYTLDYDFDA